MTRRAVIVLGRSGEVATGIFSDGTLIDTLASMPSNPDTADAQTPMPAWVIVPGEDVVLHNVELPSSNEKKALEAVPFLLEDAVADDLTELHFAVGQSATGRRIAGVISRRVMQRHLDTLSHAGIEAEVITPDYLVMGEAAVASVSVAGDRAIIALPDDQGVATDTNLLGFILPGALRAAAVTELLVQNDAAAPSISVGPEISVRKTAQPTTQEVLQRVHDRLKQRIALNLRQGIFARRRQWELDIRPLRRVAVLAALCVTLVIAQTVLSGIRLNASATQAFAFADAVARSVLPPGTKLVNARAQTKALAASVKANSANAFLVLSEQFAQSLGAASGAYVNAYQFDGGRQELAASIVVPNYESLASIRTALIARGLVVDDGSARQLGSAVLAELVVRQQ